MNSVLNPGIHEVSDFLLFNSSRPCSCVLCHCKVQEVTEERWLVYTEPVQLESEAVTELRLGYSEG